MFLPQKNLKSEEKHVSCSLFQQLWFLMKSLTRPGQLGHQKERQWIAPFIPGGVGVAALILRWKQTTVRKIHKTSQCFTLLCLLQPFSAALVSHEITHASWPTRPSKRKAMNCPVYPKSTVSKKDVCGSPPRNRVLIPNQQLLTKGTRGGGTQQNQQTNKQKGRVSKRGKCCCCCMLYVLKCCQDCMG